MREKIPNQTVENEEELANAMRGKVPLTPDSMVKETGNAAYLL